MADLTSILEDEYRITLEEVKTAKANSEEANWNLRKLSELHKQMMDERTTNSKCAAEAQETEIKQKQEKHGRTMAIVKAVTDGLAVVLPVWAGWTWMRRGLKFEESGTYTSRTQQWISNHFRLFKK